MAMGWLKSTNLWITFAFLIISMLGVGLLFASYGMYENISSVKNATLTVYDRVDLSSDDAEGWQTFALIVAITLASISAVVPILRAVALTYIKRARESTVIGETSALACGLNITIAVLGFIGLTISIILLIHYHFLRANFDSSSDGVADANYYLTIQLVGLWITTGAYFVLIVAYVILAIATKSLCLDKKRTGFRPFGKAKLGNAKFAELATGPLSNWNENLRQRR